MENTLGSDIQLTEHFRLSEFTRSATAIRYGIDNTPDIEDIEALQSLCVNVLEPLRKRFGVIRITSGYRCAKLNQMIGGALNSRHLYGEAADIFVGSREMAMKYFTFIRDNLNFDQMLLEMKAGKVHCLHVSYTTERMNRKKVSSYYHV
ncbi:MAG: peptidase M15 [Prevotella sp.]|nr:peptidase M15 [Candidatus Prevotella equi]